MKQILIILVMVLAMPAVAAAQEKAPRCMQFFTDAYKKRQNVEMTIIRNDNQMFRKIYIEDDKALCDQIEKAVSEDLKNVDKNSDIVERYSVGEVKMIFQVNGYNIIYTRSEDEVTLSISED